MTIDKVTRRVICNSIEYLQIFKAKKRGQEETKWQPPREGMLKANIDGAYRPEDDFVTWGVVIRDEAGDVVQARAGRTDHVADPFGAEVMAMAEAINMVADLGALRLVLETDSKLLQEALDFKKVDSTPYTAIIEDSKLLLKLWFSYLDVGLCRRQANTVAHKLAQIGRVCLPSESVSWHSDVPPQVALCVAGDMPMHH